MVRFGQFEAVQTHGRLRGPGVGFSLAAWLLTIGVKPLPYQVREPRKKRMTLLVYLLPLAVFIAFGFSAIHRCVAGEPADSLAMLIAKLAVFVVIPAWIVIARFGYKLV